MWQYGLVDTFTAANFIYNVGAQYSVVIFASMAEGNVTKNVIFGPITGLRIGYQFVLAAESIAERRARILTLACYLATSGASALNSNPPTNVALGGAVAAHISHMREVLKTTRGGQITFKKTKKINLIEILLSDSGNYLYKRQFNSNCKVIIDNIFQEHILRRATQASVKPVKIPHEIAPIISLSVISNQANLIGCIFITSILFAVTSLTTLYLFQTIKRRRYCVNQKKKVIINLNIDI